MPVTGTVSYLLSSLGHGVTQEVEQGVTRWTLGCFLLQQKKCWGLCVLGTLPFS